MKIISWNVNGIRAVLNKGFIDFIEKENPDIICIQETKANKEQVNLKLNNYEQIWNSAEKKGYSGTAVFTKKQPNRILLNLEKHSNEGRLITLDFGDFYVVNVYVPNAQRGLVRLDYRKEWDIDFLNYLKILDSEKPVIVCGDFNVAHKEIDLKNPGPNRKNPGFTDEEREGFTRFIENGFIDVFRYKYPNKIQYTWWSYMFNARAKNIGWRIDYFLVSNKIKDRIKDIVIMDEIMGSDHCPLKLITDY